MVGRALRRRRRDERGGVLALVAVMASVLLVMAAFAVDLGMQRVARRDMQAVADIVALDLARLLDGRTAAQITAGDATHDPLQVALGKSVARNDDLTLGDPPQVTATLVDVDALTGEPVRLASGALAPVPSGAEPDGVLVEAATSVDFGFAPGSGGAQRTALANASTFACFRLGSFAAALSSGDAAVLGVFEAAVQDALGLNLKAVGYQGLLQTFVDLPLLAAELGAGTTDQLAALPAVKVADLLAASARVLGQDGDTAAQGTVLQMSQQMSQTLRVDVADVLAVGAGSVLEGRVNLVDLLGSAALGVAAEVSNGNNFLDTGVAWAAPHVSNGTIALRAIQAPQQACGLLGQAEARTAQVEVAADLGFALPNKVGLGSLGSLDVGIPSDPTSKAGTLSVRAELGSATGRLVSARCGEGTVADPDTIGVQVQSGLLTTSVSLPLRVTGTLDTGTTSSLLPSGTLDSVLSSLGLLLGVVGKVEVVLDLRLRNTASVTTPAQAAASPTLYVAPPRTYLDAEPSTTAGPVALPSPSVVLDATGSSASVRVTTLLGAVRVEAVPVGQLNLTGLLSAVSSSVVGTSTAAVVANVNQALVPLSRLLGVRVAGADVLGVAPPACGHPRLVG
ncbi:pilus assembly protein TadG-related protein [Nocardioides perillae]|uniref:Putative membrane protein n=1 Tax=Nocardioides perillae TaxID=1119534 RepID=A0A7Y9RW04_9ACTN|nr:pilus assembly protein TadG-related protein [Nocardioides perillae]NYG56386.1 putative membrane protein [Nocardioides perillae]